MGKYNRLLVAMDGSLASKNALRQAFKLASDEKRWIIVIAINPPYRGDLALIGVSNIGDLLKGQGEKILTEAREIAEAEGVTIRTRLEEGEPFEKIIEVAEEESCDIIVMGRRGITRLERALMGSVTAKVIGHFNGKVLVVPRDTALGWKNILVANDGSQYSEIAVNEAINYAKSYNGSLKLVGVVDITDEFQAHAPGLVEKLVKNVKKDLALIKNKVQKEGVNAEIFIREGEPFQVIVNLAKQLHADTIVMGSHGRTGLKRILVGSVTSRVIGHTTCPVMVVKK
jgi:nucleotide-binding universal stress UspA family protein